MSLCLELLPLSLPFAPFQCKEANAQYKTKTRTTGKWQIYDLARPSLLDVGRRTSKNDVGNLGSIYNTSLFILDMYICINL